jgi:hypothetical protein
LFVVVVVLLTSIVRDCVSVTVIAGSVSSLPFRFRIFSVAAAAAAAAPPPKVPSLASALWAAVTKHQKLY